MGSITSGHEKINLSYSKTRYRWGKLNDCEPSRFIDEIDEKYVNYNRNKSLMFNSKRRILQINFDLKNLFFKKIIKEPQDK